METLGKNVKWQISLSNGETFFEEKGAYKTVTGELSPWNRLLAYISTNDLNITSISLYTDEGRTFNIPSLGKAPRFHEFANAQKPVKLNFFRKAGLNIGEEYEHYAVVEAIFEDQKLQLWANESDGHNCWVMVAPK